MISIYYTNTILFLNGLGQGMKIECIYWNVQCFKLTALNYDVFISK